MIKLYIHNISINEYLIIAIPILLAPFLMGTSGVYLDTIIFSHYITLVPNVIFIIFCYKQYSKINAMYTIIATRIGSFKAFFTTIIFSVTATLCYSAILYSYLAIFLKLPNVSDMKVTYLYIGTSIIIYLTEQFIMAFQIGKKKNLLYVLLPILLNFAFHYYFIPLYYI